jgi:hypothetical protein
MPVEPIFRRFWVRIMPDGSAIPQFDPMTGKYCAFEDYPNQVAQIIFLPVSPRLAELMQSQGNKAEASALKMLEFEVPPGASAHMHRVGTYRLQPMMVCGFCELEYDPELDVCPRCLAKNQFYCSKCDSLKPDPIIDTQLINSEGMIRPIRIAPSLQKWAWKIAEQLPGKWAFRGIQVRCPDCEATDPRGLKVIQCVGQFTKEFLHTHYLLEIGSKRHIILDYKLARP